MFPRARNLRSPRWPIAGLLALAAASPVRAMDRERLVSGPVLERELSSGQVAEYAISLERGQFARVVVEQRGLDVVVTSLDPSGAEILKMDRPNGSRGNETISLVAERAGTFGIRVTTLYTNVVSGRYSIRIAELRPSARERSRAPRGGARHRGGAADPGAGSVCRRERALRRRGRSVRQDRRSIRAGGRALSGGDRAGPGHGLCPRRRALRSSARNGAARRRPADGGSHRVPLGLPHREFGPSRRGSRDARAGDRSSRRDRGPRDRDRSAGEHRLLGVPARPIPEGARVLPARPAAGARGAAADVGSLGALRLRLHLLGSLRAGEVDPLLRGVAPHLARPEEPRGRGGRAPGPVALLLVDRSVAEGVRRRRSDASGRPRAPRRPGRGARALQPRRGRVGPRQDRDRPRALPGGERDLETARGPAPGVGCCGRRPRPRHGRRARGGGRDVERGALGGEALREPSGRGGRARESRPIGIRPTGSRLGAPARGGVDRPRRDDSRGSLERVASVLVHGRQAGCLRRPGRRSAGARSTGAGRGLRRAGVRRQRTGPRARPSRGNRGSAPRPDAGAAARAAPARAGARGEDPNPARVFVFCRRRSARAGGRGMGPAGLGDAAPDSALRRARVPGAGLGRDGRGGARPGIGARFVLLHRRPRRGLRRSVRRA